LIAVGASGPISCQPGRLNVDALGNTASREVMPIDDNAASYDNLYDAIEHIRPEYLRVRQQGTTPMVPVAYLNGVRLADASMLRLVPVSWTAAVRWVRPNTNSWRYQFKPNLGGGIFVTTWK
jgi:hypothetical protein